ncbi:MAG: helix-turn-helix transcriptional regulator [Clostridia bacterium]|nr:helix-turn-helix transcriptional regulator [Clostridia bacterium]
MTFGEKLRLHRTKMKMSQSELALKAGLGINTIGNYESGKTYPKDRRTYGVLAEILGVDADYLHNENDDFISAAREKYGLRGKKDAEALLGDINGLFAGGDLADEDMDEFMRAVQESFWRAKEKNRKKYTRRDYAVKD